MSGRAVTTGSAGTGPHNMADTDVIDDHPDHGRAPASQRQEIGGLSKTSNDRIMQMNHNLIPKQ